MAKCNRGEACECTGSRLTLRMFCQHWNAERPENEVERESIRMWSSLGDYTRERCLKHLRRKIPSDVIFGWYAQRRKGFAIGSDAIRFHFDVGMQVRNTLREVVPDEQLPLVRSIRGGELCIDQTTWDDYYYGALYDLVGGEESDPPTWAGMSPVCGDPVDMTAKSHHESPYRAKCKRFRADGPTPCLCCPGECIGDRPGHTYDEAVDNDWDRPLSGQEWWKLLVWLCTFGLIRI